MRVIKCLTLIILTIIFTSCSSKVENNIKTTPIVTQSIVKTNVKNYETERLKSLQIELKEGEIYFSSWGKKEVSVEIETIASGARGKEDLEKNILEVRPLIVFKDDMLSIGDPVYSVNKNITLSNRIKISAPCEIKNISITVEKGSFTSSGDIITSARMKLAKGNANFSRFQGVVDAEVANGNIGIRSGRLYGASSLISESGNINVKTEILTKDNYKFEVGVGNIELSLPARISGDFSCQGNIVANDFKSSPIGSKIIVSSKQGAITLKKY